MSIIIIIYLDYCSVNKYNEEIEMITIKGYKI